MWTHEADRYAPPDRRAEAETVSRQRAAARDTGNLDSVIHRVASASMDEIDAVIRELEGMREILRNEAERVSLDVAAFASLNQSSISAMKIISDSLKALKKIPSY